MIKDEHSKDELIQKSTFMPVGLYHRKLFWRFTINYPVIMLLRFIGILNVFTWTMTLRFYAGLQAFLSTLVKLPDKDETDIQQAQVDFFELLS